MFFEISNLFLWLFILASLVLYTFFALDLPLRGNRSRILSERNAKPREDIILVHVIFLLLMLSILFLESDLLLAWGLFSAFRYSRLSTELFGAFECSIFYVVAKIEQRFIYLDIKTNTNELPDDLDYY